MAFLPLRSNGSVNFLNKFLANYCVINKRSDIWCLEYRQAEEQTYRQAGRQAGKVDIDSDATYIKIDNNFYTFVCHRKWRHSGRLGTECTIAHNHCAECAPQTSGLFQFCPPFVSSEHQNKQNVTSIYTDNIQVGLILVSFMYRQVCIQYIYIYIYWHKTCMSVCVSVCFIYIYIYIYI